ncbi:IS66 family transposase [Chondrinema litorale]|uniref:IS66 family transposase n=1 Tax=Chondrinema litorale TaxID=2994555 RepID=UPI002543C1C5|nr:IS66 family transposase [Chondrinema litorale]UZR96299.1 IS66 family transposase [Chondrinema litorale]
MTGTGDTTLLEQNAALIEEKKQLLEQVESLKAELSELKRLIYGSKRERFIPSDTNSKQLTLPLDENVSAETPAKVKQTISYQRATQGEKLPQGSSRQPLPAHLPRKEVVLEPEVDTTHMRKIGEEITEELDMTPAKVFVRRYIRPRYVSKEEEFYIANLPARPIDKGIPGPGLLAHILVDKFCHHLPFYRQQKRFNQLGIKIAPSTLGNWLKPACQLLDPLYEALRFEVLNNNYLQVDESPIKVLDDTKKGKTHRGYYWQALLWVYYSPEQQVVLFDYQKGRSREGPVNMLQGYEGYIQTDGYKVYDQLLEEEGMNIILVGCIRVPARHLCAATLKKL